MLLIPFPLFERSEVNQDVSIYVTNKDGVINKDEHVEANEEDDIPFGNIMKRITENITKSQDVATQEKDKEVVDMDEETEVDEEYVVIVMKSISRSVDDRLKEKSI
ncbi:hypothetical protein RYX36_016115 [Vicia faba]